MEIKVLKELGNMKRKIILSNSLTNINRFIIKTNLEGIKILNYSKHSLSTLIKQELLTIKPNTRLISPKESAYILLTLIQGDKGYRLNKYVTSLSAAESLLEVINDIRLCGSNDYSALFDADYVDLLNDYQNYLNNGLLLDYYSALLEVKNIDKKIDADCYLLDDISLYPLEEELLKSLFNSIVYIPGEDDKKVEVNNIYKCYGQYNEVLNVLDVIEKENMPLGDVEIIYSSPVYENIIRGLCDSRKVPYSLKGKHIRSSNLVSFLQKVVKYIASDYRYELLDEILSNPALPNEYLEEYRKTFSYPKLVVGFSKKRSLDYIALEHDNPNYIHFMNFFSDLLLVSNDDYHINYLNLLELAKKYLLCTNELDNLYEPLKELNHIISLEKEPKKRIKLILDELNSATINEADIEDGLSISPISKSFTLRPYLFVLGANQTLLLGSDIENAFIFDLDSYVENLKDNKNLHLSKNTREKPLNNLNYYLSNSYETDIYLSYSYFDKVELKDMVSGIQLLNISCPNKEIKINLFETNYLPSEKKDKYHFTRQVEGSSYRNEEYDNGYVKELESVDQINNDEASIVAQNTIITPDNIETKPLSLSPTDVHDLLHCPYGYHYKKVIKLDNVQNPTLDEAEWLAPNTRGTFFHEIMELYFNHFVKKNTFEFEEKIYEEAFAKALKNAKDLNPDTNQSISDMEIKDMEKLSRAYLKYLYASDHFVRYRVLKNEADLAKLGFTYPNDKNEETKKFVFKGKVDRVDYALDTANNILHLRLVDYKTGRYKEKSDNKYRQHVIYSYILERNEEEEIKKVCEYFRLPIVNKIVVDEFIYDFPVSLRGLSYIPNEFKEESSDYKEVFSAINKIIIPFINNDQSYYVNLDALFEEKYEIKGTYDNTKRGQGVCEYCIYKNECIKRMEKGYKKWDKKKQQ